MNPVNQMPKRIPAKEMAEERRVQQAVDKLPYGKFNAKAQEVEAKARADFRKEMEAKAGNH